MGRGGRHPAHSRSRRNHHRFGRSTRTGGAWSNRRWQPRNARVAAGASKFSRMKLVECVPNFSEGRRPEVVARIREAIAAVPGVHIFDVSSDQSHNRTVITFVVPVDTAVDAAFAGIKAAHDA